MSICHLTVVTDLTISSKVSCLPGGLYFPSLDAITIKTYSTILKDIDSDGTNSIALFSPDFLLSR